MAAYFRREVETVFVLRLTFSSYENTVRIARMNRESSQDRYRGDMAGRREQLRETLLQSIRGAALDELRRVGPAELSLREVARLAGISPSGLYRYVEGRDGLLELLIADGFERFGSSVGSAIAAAGPAFADQIGALAVSYRRWAKENPEQFALILGSPVAGFQPDPTGPTSIAVRHFGMPMLQVIIDAAANGQLAKVDLSSEASIVLDPSMPSIPAGLLDIAMRSWGRIHGLVILEAFGHLGWTSQDVAVTLRNEARAIAAEFGAVAPKTAKKTVRV
jgi:AcrR family transcriptional regulator